MSKVKLHEGFVKALQEKIPQRAELVNKLSEILCIEKEPVSRRLSGRVQFSANEIGVLSRELGISLDSLVYKDLHCHWFPLLLKSPLGADSMEVLYDIMYESLDAMNDIAGEEMEYGVVFNSLPMEYYVYYPHLMKFMFFKWGHYFVGTDEFNDFASWELPDRLSDLGEKIENILAKSEHTLYIWDEALVWTLVNEIEYFYKMDILKAEDLENIKNDLKQSLENLERYLSGIYKPEKASKNISFYVSNMNFGVSSHYLSSEKGRQYGFKTNFTFSSSVTNSADFDEIRDWINSFKNISVLISGSGPLDRKLFFIKQ
ncbi:hypothetical protein LJC68_08615, partial [Bacteroidales bacterium OttesenSCG-928-B11]|nr:hypothetical protein [Bacteroidales bacterium OttesenSCG-928-B11]MDL2326597.1 hypothetical protein [Bacteroidales bacterium OttesenSCG-928-A14]